MKTTKGEDFISDQCILYYHVKNKVYTDQEKNDLYNIKYDECLGLFNKKFPHSSQERIQELSKRTAKKIVDDITNSYILKTIVVNKKELNEMKSIIEESENFIEWCPYG